MENFSHTKRIRIISPSGVIEPALIDGAANVFRSWGFDVSEGKFAREVYGRFAGTEAQRIQDLLEAINDKDLMAILCSRGGYGLAQIVDKIDFSGIEEYPKWIIGFSDVTILHAVLSNRNIPSIHGIMAKHLTELPDDTISRKNLREILLGNNPIYSIPSDSLNRLGHANGKLIGGNLSVLSGLRGSKYDLDYHDAILFIEDIGEQPYHIDRMMQNFRLSGIFSQLSGLIVGSFTNCTEDPLMHKNIKEIILSATHAHDFPVCFGFPSGHEEINYPLILGKRVSLAVSADTTILDFN
ncbi:MAG: LD-carboxypeptidase [Paludibacter sp.]|nr:LD-carboxypeptidase [Paludibacter sp.]